MLLPYPTFLPPRLCAVDGCKREVAPGAHFNTRLCDEHKPRYGGKAIGAPNPRPGRPRRVA